MTIPPSLYIVPTEDLDEGEKLDGLLTSGWENPPSKGSKLLVVPEKDGQQLRQIRWIYTVKSVTETGRRDWKWELDVSPKAVATPRRWYDIVDEVLRQGLVSIVGSHGEGDQITHEQTIRLILEMLEEA